jgi:hypothetical protein
MTSLAQERSMASRTVHVFSGDELSGLLAALDDPVPAVSIAALRALVRLPVDPAVRAELEPHCSSVERSDWAWSTWIPDKATRKAIGALLDSAAEAEVEPIRLARTARSSIIRRFAQLALDEEPDPLSHEMLAGSEELSAEVHRRGRSVLPEVAEIFDAYRVFLPRAGRFWFSWVEEQRWSYDAEHALPSWFPMHEGPLAVTRQLEWIASRVGLETLLAGLQAPLQHGSACDRFAAAQLIEWARRAEDESHYPRFGGGAGPGDVLISIDADLLTKDFGVSGLQERGTKTGIPGAAVGLPRRRPSSKRSTSTVVPKAAKPPQQKQQQGWQEPRWILTRAFDLSTKRPNKPTLAFRAGARHEIQVIIGADQPDWLVARGHDASQSIDSMLPKGTHELTVVFFLPDSGTQTRKLTLPPNGPTPKPAKFCFDVGSAGSRIQALISIVHRGGVLQTAILSGVAVPDPLTAPEEAQITLRLQVVVPGFAELDRREPFDVALVAAKTASRNAVAAGLVHSGPDSGKTLCFRQPRIDKAAQSIRATLEDVVTDESLQGGLGTKAAQALLWKLAQHGRILYECIGQRLEKELAGRDLSRLQLVQTDPSAFIPIEFVYDLPPPANGAPLCRNWQAALTGRPCTANHHKVDALGHLGVVCPSGFWSVSKVIERQILEDLTAEELANSDFGVRAEPTAKRPSLPPIGSALFAWSEILDNAVPGTSADVLKSLDRATGKHAAAVSTWLEWAEAVAERHPALLVLLSHTVDDALEIGPEDSGERATLAQINSRFVKKLAQDAPIVFLLGCDTAVSDDKLVSFVGRFRDQGAALVVGTITPVLGEHSAAVVKAVISKLAQKRERPASFGELMRDARRDLLSKGELTALCATSFGDASWLVS